MLKILLDANLSHRIIPLLSKTFETILHVNQLELTFPAKDIEIWNWAKENEFMIVTNDEDFFYFLLQKGFPPKIILLRTGNQSSKRLVEVLTLHRNDIIELKESETLGILEIY